jgi:hypothetical protein
MFSADKRRSIVHAISAGDVKSDVIKKLPAATVCGRGTTLVSMRNTLPNLHDNISAETEQLNLA